MRSAEIRDINVGISHVIAGLNGRIKPAFIDQLARHQNINFVTGQITDPDMIVL